MVSSIVYNLISLLLVRVLQSNRINRKCISVYAYMQREGGRERVEGEEREEGGERKREREFRFHK